MGRFLPARVLWMVKSLAMFPFINLWSLIDLEDIPPIELSDRGFKILLVVTIVLVVLLIALIVYATCFMFK